MGVASSVSSFQEAFVEMHVCAAFLVDNDTELLVTDFQEALECLYLKQLSCNKEVLSLLHG